MNLIFITSYLNLQCVVDLIEHEGSDFKILTSNKNVIKVFKRLYGSNCIIELPEALFSSFLQITKLLRDFFVLQVYKIIILRECRKLKPSKVFFFYLGWNGFESWLIKKLSKQVSVYYSLKVDVSGLASNYSIRMRVKAFLAGLIYGVKFESSLYYGYPMLTIGDSFLKDVKANNYTRSLNFSKIINFL